MAYSLIYEEGAPASAGGNFDLTIYTVPTGKTWALKYYMVAARCTNTGVTPEGGEWTPFILTDLTGSYQGIGESSLETGNRYAQQGHGPIDLVLPAGTHIKTGYFLRAAKTTTNYDYKIAIIYDEETA